MLGLACPMICATKIVYAPRSVLPQVDANRASARSLLRAHNVAGLHCHGVGSAHPGGIHHGRICTHALVGYAEGDRVAIDCSAQREIGACGVRAEVPSKTA